MKRLNRHRHLLTALGKAPRPLQKVILEKMPPDAIKAIKEIGSNLLHGNLQLKRTLKNS